MSFVKNAIILLLVFISPYLFSQEGFQIEDYNVLQGIWENESKIISLHDDDDGNTTAQVVLKTFYGYYYDGLYPLDPSVPINLARFENSLYAEYWKASTAYATLGNPIIEEEEENPVFKVKIEKPAEFDFATALPAEGVLWLPQSNTTELSIDPTKIKNEVLGYYVNDSATYEIRYWLSSLPYSDEKVELELVPNSENSSVFIDKYIQIGDQVYTSATGLRTMVRNVTSISPFSENTLTNEDNTILVFGEPYLELSDIININDEILAHNSIQRPPRDGRARFVEPSIYKKLESMSIDDFDNPYGATR